MPSTCKCGCEQRSKGPTFYRSKCALKVFFSGKKKKELTDEENHKYDKWVGNLEVSLYPPLHTLLLHTRTHTHTNTNTR